mmetsp:Transcript_8773/g.13543  ORF Transcript_8773/g.13543 Transcript_8773/m.13543 type:complete len:101 (+) Transcript_8773:197-499(+)
MSDCCSFEYDDNHHVIVDEDGDPQFFCTAFDGQPHCKLVNPKQLIFFGIVLAAIIMLSLLVYGCVLYNKKKREVLKLKVQLRKMAKRMKEVDPSFSVGRS